MTSSAADVDPEASLRSLIAAGYRFVHPRDEQGDVLAVVGVRAHDNVVDVVRIDGEDEVTARRVPGDEENVLEPDHALWQQRGRVDSVVTDLLTLADDDYPAAPDESVRGCWVPAGEGRSAFLMAS